MELNDAAVVSETNEQIFDLTGGNTTKEVKSGFIKLNSIKKKRKKIF